jgi:hypothetical protein
MRYAVHAKFLAAVTLGMFTNGTEGKREMLLHEFLQAKPALTRMLPAAWRA